MINDKEVTLEELKNKVKEFCEKRDWDQFHNPKELAIGMSTEANELLQIFRFKSEKEMKQLMNSEKITDVEDELADIDELVDTGEQPLHRITIVADKGQSPVRIDKFLIDHLANTSRNKIQQAADAGSIAVNGKVQKASYNVKIGDEITVAFGTKSVTVRVLDIRDTTKKAEAVGMYEVVSETNS